MKLFSSLSGAVSRLSARERLLLGVATAIGAVMLAIYAVRLPGEAAARSASSRNALAAVDLTEARALTAGNGSTNESDKTLLDQLSMLATERGLSVVDSRVVGDGLVLLVSSPSSSGALAWAAEASATTTPLRSLSITPGASTELVVEAAFAGPGS